MLTPKEVAEKLRISPKTVIKYLNKGVIKGDRIPKTVYTYTIDERSIEDFISYMKVKPGRGKRPEVFTEKALNQDLY